MPTSLVPPVRRSPSGKSSMETLFRHKYEIGVSASSVSLLEEEACN